MSEESLPERKKRSNWKYLIYILLILAATGLSLFLSLRQGKAQTVWNAFKTAKPLWILAMVGVLLFAYLIDALIIKIFSRLYVHRYGYGQAVAVSMIGAFYNSITPGALGGQVMQAYTLKRQGIPISSAASIMVMWLILYQAALVVLDVVSMLVNGSILTSLAPVQLGGWSIPVVWIIAIGFCVNVGFVLMVLLMSYSHGIHNFILRYVLGFLGKIHLIQNVDKSRERLRVQIENYKLELRRLQSNIPIAILILALFLARFLLLDSLPYFAGLSLDAFQANRLGQAYGVFRWKDAVQSSFLSAFHQMCATLIPLPGNTGSSEYFYMVIFQKFFEDWTYVEKEGAWVLSGKAAGITSATQILWRFMTYHIILLISGLVAAFYRARPRKEEVASMGSQTFVNLQMETYMERQHTADTMYETSQLSRKALQEKFRRGGKKEKDVEIPGEEEETRREQEERASSPEEAPILKKKEERHPKKPKKEKRRPAKDKKGEDTGDEEGWDSISIH